MAKESLTVEQAYEIIHPYYKVDEYHYSFSKEEYESGKISLAAMKLLETENYALVCINDEEPPSIPIYEYQLIPAWDRSSKRSVLLG